MKLYPKRFGKGRRSVSKQDLDNIKHLDSLKGTGEHSGLKVVGGKPKAGTSSVH